MFDESWFSDALLRDWATVIVVVFVNSYSRWQHNLLLVDVFTFTYDCYRIEVVQTFKSKSFGLWRRFVLG